MERRPTPAVSAIIVAYRSENDLRTLLPALRPLVADVVVVDNASPDNSAQVALDHHATLVRRATNDGFAAGVNAGVEACAGDLLLLLNPDVRLDREAVTQLVEAAARHPGDVVGPLVERPDGRVQPTRRGVPTLWNLLGEEAFLPESSRLGRWPARLWPRWQGYDREVVAPLLSGVCLLVPRTTWKSVGSLDERYFLYWEEVDWQLRARRLGIRTWLIPAARVTHHRSSSTGELTPTKARMLAASTRIFVHRWFPPRQRAVALAILAGGQLVRAAAWSAPPHRGRPGAPNRRRLHLEAFGILAGAGRRGDGTARGGRPTLWLVDLYGRGGIARYAVDVANLLTDGPWRPVVATNSLGPASGLRGGSVRWFPSRPGTAGMLRAAVGGLTHAVSNVGRHDVAWLPLGIRPAYEFALARALRIRGVRLIGTVHNRGPHHHARPSPLVRRTAAACHGIVVHTHAVATWAESAGLPVVRLPFPVPDLRHCAPAQRYDRATLAAADERLVLMFGNLYLYKGIDVLLEAFADALHEEATLPLRLVLAGQTTRAYDPGAHARRLGLASRTNVLAGYLPDSELLDLLSVADAVALPYRRVDHSGAGALAVAHGLPAIASDLPALREVFGPAALYVAPDNCRELADALRALPGALPALRAAAVRRHPARPQLGAQYARALEPLVNGDWRERGRRSEPCPPSSSGRV